MNFLWNIQISSGIVSRKFGLYRSWLEQFPQALDASISLKRILALAWNQGIYMTYSWFVCISAWLQSSSWELDRLLQVRFLLLEVSPGLE
jgi:hypothetical protein